VDAAAHPIGSTGMIRLADKRRTLAAVRALPDVIDLLVIGVRAGLTPELAVRKITPFCEPPFAAALRSVVDRIDCDGHRFADALDGLIADVGDPARPVVAALTGAERYGLPLAPALDALAQHARTTRRRQADIAARRLPVLLALPLVGCILPAFAVLSVAPALIGALRALNP
jgi:tight adherence protein C